MSDTEPCNAQRSTEKAACVLTGDWLHIRRPNLQALRHKAARAENVDRLRREAALWRAGVRCDAGELLLVPATRRPGSRRCRGGAGVRGITGRRARHQGSTRGGGVVTDMAEPLAEQLQAAIDRARHQAESSSVPTSWSCAWLPTRPACRSHPIGSLFLRQYDGPADADHLIVAWHQVSKRTTRSGDRTSAEREADARIEQYRQALERRTENADE